MRLKPKSLQGRLLLGILATLAVTLAGGGLLIYRVVDTQLREEFDVALEEKVRFYSTTLSLRNGSPKWRMGEAEWQRVSDPANPDYVQFWFLPQGRFIYRTPGLKGTDLPRVPLAGTAPAFTDLNLFGTTAARMVSRQVFPTQEADGSLTPVQVAVARDTASLMLALDRVKWLIIKTAVLTTLLLMLATRWIVRRGVKPVAGLAGQIEAMPLVDSDARFGLPGAPSELQPVVGRLNALMDRVGAAIEHERMFTSNAAHELRNPLAAIRSRVELALSRTRSVEEYEETLDGILESQNGMQRVVDHLLLLARLESGHQIHEFAEESVSLSKLLRKAWRPVFDRASDRHLKVIWQVTEPPAELILPAALVEIVLRNLFDNAAAYTPEHGSIVITAVAVLEVGAVPGLPGGAAVGSMGGMGSMSGNGDASGRGFTVHLTVANTDPGLAPADLESTFAPFWRGDPNASGHRGNAGIGLALVRRIMETMHGTAGATLESGMVVYSLRFPVKTAAAVPAPAVLNTISQGGSVSPLKQM